MLRISEIIIKKLVLKRKASKQGAMLRRSEIKIKKNQMDPKKKVSKHGAMSRIFKKKTRF